MLSGPIRNNVNNSNGAYYDKGIENDGIRLFLIDILTEDIGGTPKIKFFNFLVFGNLDENLTLSQFTDVSIKNLVVSRISVSIPESLIGLFSDYFINMKYSSDVCEIPLSIWKRLFSEPLPGVVGVADDMSVQSDRYDNLYRYEPSDVEYLPAVYLLSGATHLWCKSQNLRACLPELRKCGISICMGAMLSTYNDIDLYPELSDDELYSLIESGNLYYNTEYKKLDSHDYSFSGKFNSFGDALQFMDIQGDKSALSLIRVNRESCAISGKNISYLNLLHRAFYNLKSLDVSYNLDLTTNGDFAYTPQGAQQVLVKVNSAKHGSNLILANAVELLSVKSEGILEDCFSRLYLYAPITREFNIEHTGEFAKSDTFVMKLPDVGTFVLNSKASDLCNFILDSDSDEPKVDNLTLHLREMNSYDIDLSKFASNYLYFTLVLDDAANITRQGVIKLGSSRAANLQFKANEQVFGLKAIYKDMSDSNSLKINLQGLNSLVLDFSNPDSGIISDFETPLLGEDLYVNCTTKFSIDLTFYTGTEDNPVMRLNHLWYCFNTLHLNCETTTEVNDLKYRLRSVFKACCGIGVSDYNLDYINSPLYYIRIARRLELHWQDKDYSIDMHPIFEKAILAYENDPKVDLTKLAKTMFDELVSQIK